MPQSLAEVIISPLSKLAATEGVEWEPLGKSAVELSNSTLPYAVPLHTFRLEVPGGWLVLVMTGGNDTSLTFMPDPFHEWDGGTGRRHPLR